MISPIMKLLKKALLWFAPYKIVFDCPEGIQTYKSWTYADALEWVGCAMLKEDIVFVHHKYKRRSKSLIAWRYTP